MGDVFRTILGKDSKGNEFITEKDIPLNCILSCIEIPKGSIERLTGRLLAPGENIVFCNQDHELPTMEQMQLSEHELYKVVESLDYRLSIEKEHLIQMIMQKHNLSYNNAQLEINKHIAIDKIGRSWQH